MNSNKQKMNLKLILPILFLIICAAAFIIYMLVFKPAASEPTPYGTSNYVMDESNLTSIKTDNPDMEKVDEGMFEVSMNVNWMFKNGTTASGNAYVANAFTNSNPIVFDIILEDEDTPVYTSSVIPVGSQINDIILEKDLEKGSYPAVCTYHLLDEAGEEISTVSVNVTLDIQN